jgi:hypothetical protein
VYSSSKKSHYKKAAKLLSTKLKYLMTIKCYREMVFHNGIGHWSVGGGGWVILGQKCENLMLDSSIVMGEPFLIFET